MRSCVSVFTPRAERLFGLLALELGLAVVNDAFGRASQLIEGLLGDLFGNQLSVRIMEHAWGGIAFADETAADRDSDGILWTRITSQPGCGRPQFAVIHSLRQRRAMRRLLCQVCGQPADRNPEGVLWLLPDYYRRHDGLQGCRHRPFRIWPQGDPSRRA